jgi:hypothetical protein
MSGCGARQVMHSILEAIMLVSDRVPGWSSETNGTTLKGQGRRRGSGLNLPRWYSPSMIAEQCQLRVRARAWARRRPGDIESKLGSGGFSLMSGPGRERKSLKLITEAGA